MMYTNHTDPCAYTCVCPNASEHKNVSGRRGIDMFCLWCV